MPVRSINDAPGYLPGEESDPRVAEFSATYGPVLDHWQAPFTIRTDLATVEKYGSDTATITTAKDGVSVTTRMSLADGDIFVIAHAAHPVTLTVTL